MNIISKRTLQVHRKKFGNAKKPLIDWENTVLRSKWTNLKDVRKIYRNADAVKVDSGRTLTIFNIKGGKYRLLTCIHYNSGRIYIRDFLPHKIYETNRWKTLH